MTSRNVADPLAALDGQHRREDHLDAGDLARQRVARKHALAMAARLATGQRDLQHRDPAPPRRRVQLARHPRPGQPKLRPTANRAAAALEQSGHIAARETRLIAARLHTEYVSHVLDRRPRASQGHRGRQSSYRTMAGAQNLDYAPSVERTVEHP